MDNNERQIILVNFKRVGNAVAEGLVKEFDKLDDNTRKRFEVVLALQTQDALALANEISLTVFLQDIYCQTGFQFLSMTDGEVLRRSRLGGVVLNHPEKKLKEALLDKHIAKARAFGLPVMLCATNSEEGCRLNRKYKPEYMAIENEKLIGKDISFSRFCPEAVGEAVGKIKARVLFGGGIKTGEDVRHIRDHGGCGVLISSLVLKSAQPLATLRNLLDTKFYN